MGWEGPGERDCRVVSLRHCDSGRRDNHHSSGDRPALLVVSFLHYPTPRVRPSTQFEPSTKYFERASRTGRNREQWFSRDLCRVDRRVPGLVRTGISDGVPRGFEQSRIHGLPNSVQVTAPGLSVRAVLSAVSEKNQRRLQANDSSRGS